MAMEFDLIPQGTLLQEDGSGAAVDIRDSSTRTFFSVMVITDQIEQESVDVNIWGCSRRRNLGHASDPEIARSSSAYRGETRAVLDLTMVPEVNFIRAGWELKRWGRVAPLPMFVLGVHLAEIPAMPSRVQQVQVTAAK